MDSCLHRVDDTSGWLHALRLRAARERIPLTGHLELTRCCNLRCPHCYLGKQDVHQANRALECESDTVKAAITEWAEAGCLHLVITGGEPLLRPDFADIYQHAAEQGLFVTVFTNATLVTDRILERFREFPPRSVEVSLYGATPETYEAVTGISGSHQRAWQGIRRLHDNGIRIFLKTMLLTTNQHELGAMAEQAKSLGCKFRYDAAIIPCIADQDPSPMQLRVSPETALQWDLSFPDRRRAWAESVKRYRERPVSDSVYSCGAGLTAFFVDAFGGLSPCLMTPHHRSPERGRSFHEVWRDELGRIRDRKRTRQGGCLTGEQRGLCGHCPAANYLETGDEETDSEYMQRTVAMRYAAAMKENKEDT